MTPTPHRDRWYRVRRRAPRAHDPMSIDYEHHRRNIVAFLEAVETGERFALDATEARKAVEIVEAIHESAEHATPVAIE